jgi:heptosyltransferase-2
MKRKVLRSIDKSAGRLVTLILTGYDRTLGYLMRRLAPQSQPGRPPKRILAIKIVGIGDTVLMLTPLTALRRRFPEAKITALVTPLSSGIISRQPMIDDVMVYDILGKQQGVLDLLKLMWELARRRFDCVIDFEQYFQFTAVLGYLSGAPLRIGLYNRNHRKHLFTHPVFLDPDSHMVDIYMKLLEPLGIQADPVKTLEDIHVSAEDESEILTLLGHAGIEEDQLLVGIHAGSGPRAPHKRWALERFVEIIQRLKHNLNPQVVLTGSKEEQQLVDRIIDLAGAEGVHNMAGRLSINQTAALIRRCDLFLSNDTGPMHISAAVGTPTIGLFGPEAPCRYAPVGARNVYIHRPIECTPCVHIYAGRADECKDPICMKRISVVEVWAAIQQYDLKRPRRLAPNVCPQDPERLR